MPKLRVFLVDDHPIFVDSLQVLLPTRAEYKVVGKAGGCASAIEAVKTCRPDVVLMDLSMADMSGMEATRQILAALPRTRVVALTMHKEEAFVAGFFQAGSSVYLVKDTDAKFLFVARTAASRGERYLSPSLAGRQPSEYLQRNPERRSHRLSLRELEVLRLIVEGRGRKEISKLLNISVRTLDTHRTNIIMKPGCKSTAELVHRTLRANLIET
jgi:two-component system, NarL family, response regulator NreC